MDLTYVELHLTQLTQWLVRLIGRAVLAGAVAGGLVGVVALVVGQREILLVAAGLAVVVSGTVLATAVAPAPLSTPADSAP